MQMIKKGSSYIFLEILSDKLLSNLLMKIRLLTWAFSKYNYLLIRFVDLNLIY